MNPIDEIVSAHKDGVRLSILHQTSANSVRQGTQALAEWMREQIGVETELRNIDAAGFFGGDPASPDTCNESCAGVRMYTDDFEVTDPGSCMARPQKTMRQSPTVAQIEDMLWSRDRTRQPASGTAAFRPVRRRRAARSVHRGLPDRPEGRGSGLAGSRYGTLRMLREGQCGCPGANTTGMKEEWTWHDTG